MLAQYSRRFGMMAWIVRLGLLLVVGLAIAGAFWAPPGWAWVIALAVPAALMAGLAAVLALEFACARLLGRSPSAGGPPLKTLLSAWWQEIWTTARLVVWRVPFLSARLQPPQAAPCLGKRGLVLVHGYGCNRGLWAGWLAQLTEQQVPCEAVTLEPIFASISDHAPLIERAVVRLQRRTGLAPVVVGHSMGGLAARAWWAQDPTAGRLHRLITIGTPHQGTLMARLGAGLGARQMRPGSDWLGRLQALEKPAHAQRTLCFYSACDNVVLPSSAATLPGADNRELFACAHVAMVDHPDCFAAAMRCLLESD